MKHIPPLNPLRFFETVARLGSLTRAAAELHVTHSAVSRQITVLEQYLGAQLFDRHPRGVTLTRTGTAYYQEIGTAFGLISSATRRLMASTEMAPLKIRVYTTFAAKWLMQRLPRFQARHPDILVEISTSVAQVDFTRDELDLAIQFGPGDWPGAICERLLDDWIEPVCSPSLLRSHGGTLLLDKLLETRLLHSRYRRSDWPDWLRALDRPDLAEQIKDRTIGFPSSMLTYQAAIEGLGVAVGQMHLLEHEFETGLLVRPFAQPIRRALAYYLLCPEGRDETPKSAAFREWLHEEAARIKAPDAGDAA